MGPVSMSLILPHEKSQRIPSRDPASGGMRRCLGVWIIFSQKLDSPVGDELKEERVKEF